jgi:uncharacterized protein YbjT (DUF2867 family)
MTYLIIAATGRTPSDIVRHLRDAGEPVRVLVRDRGKAEAMFDPGVEIVAGPFDEPGTLATAFRGAEVAFLALGSGPDQIRLEKAVIDGAERAGLPHLVKLSSVGVGHDSPIVVGRLHAEIEDHLKSSGLSYTLLRPSSFVNNLLAAAPMIAAGPDWYGAAPTGRVSYVDIRDVAEASAIVLRDPTLWGGIHDWSGPDALTFPEVAALLSTILGRTISYRPVTPAQRTASLLERGLPEWVAELAVSLDVGAESGDLLRSTPDLRELLGRELRTVEEFLRENAAAFGGS